MSSDVEIEELVSSIKNLNETLENLIKYGREVVADSTDEFVNKKIGRLFGLASAYKACLQRLGLQSKDELERTISKHSRHAEVRESSADLLDLEEEITALSGKVIVVSFGLQDGAELWLNDTNVPFPMLLDPSRKIYHTFGLYRSVQKVWGIVSMVYYGEAMLTGKPLPKPYENVHDDTQQMGGDFILDHDGLVRFLYPSQTNTDRPSVDQIIEELKKIKNDA